jgi:hypothetical protein
MVLKNSFDGDMHLGVFYLPLFFSGALGTVQ